MFVFSKRVSLAVSRNNRLLSTLSNLPKSSLTMEIMDEPGALHEVLRYFWKYDVNITRIESRPTKRDTSTFEFFVDFYGKQGDRPVDLLLENLKRKTIKLFILGEREVPFFPRQIADLDRIADRTLDAGIDLQADHPGFNDKVYRKRRAKLAETAMAFRHGDKIPDIDYSPDELNTWKAVWDKITPLHAQYACREYRSIMRDLATQAGYTRDTIPQQQTMSEYLQHRTGFRLRPVAGLLSSRDFLNGLAFKTFFCTQYIRHSQNPLYTPEPDICHELLGHAPMFADQDFCDFSQEFGLASLGASDSEITKLARCYWHSVEFGLVKQDGGALKAYGAGLLSSFGELEYACKVRAADDKDPQPEYKPWDPEAAGAQEFPITTYQPVYFVADSLGDAKQRMRAYSETLQKPFNAKYNNLSESIWVDRAVKCKDV